MRGLIVLALLSGCGAEEDAPPPANPTQHASCPAMVELAPNLMAMLEGGELSAIAGVLGDEQTLTRQQLSKLLDTVFGLLRALGREDIHRLLSLADDPALQRLVPLLRDLLVLVAGDPGDPSSFRADVLAEISRLLRVCDGERVFGALEALSSAPELPTLVAALGETLALPLVSGLLAEGSDGLFSRAGFTAFVCNVVFNLARPDFDFEERVRRPLSGIELLPADAPPLSTLLESASALLTPAGPVFPALADVVCCDVYGRERCEDLGPDAQPLARDPVFTWFVYDLLTSERVDATALLATLAEVGADDALARALAPLTPVLRELSADPELRGVLLRVVDALLQPDVSRAAFPELIAFVDRGGVSELLAVLRAILQGCDP